MTPTRVALPVPRPGTAMSDEGDAYVASLDVELRGPDGTVVLDGTTFEALVSALELRYLAFHARTRGATSGSVTTEAVRRRVADQWSQVDT